MLLIKYPKREIKVLMQFCMVFAQKVLAQGSHHLKHILPVPYLITKSFHCNIVGFLQWGTLILIFVFFINCASSDPKATNITCFVFIAASEKNLLGQIYKFSGPKYVTFLIKISEMASSSHLCVPLYGLVSFSLPLSLLCLHLPYSSRYILLCSL